MSHVPLSPLLKALGGNAGAPAKFAQYDFTDASTGSFESAIAKLAPWGQLIKFEKLNIERPPMERGFQAEYYDVMVASDVLHATTDMPNTMRNVGTGLVGGGRGEESDQEGIRSYGHDDGVDDDGQKLAGEVVRRCVRGLREKGRKGWVMVIRSCTFRSSSFL